MDIKSRTIYNISLDEDEKDILLADIKKLNDGEASLEELKVLTDIYGFFLNR